MTDQDPQLIPPAEPSERNWIPMAIAAAVVLLLAVAVILFLEHHRPALTVTPITAPTDPYAANLAISQVAMSESTNLAGGKVTYIDGRISNHGPRTVTAVALQVLFRDPAHEVAQNETQQLRLVRTREPYVDLEPLSAAPLKPGEEHDFRLIFDTVTQDWDGAYPEMRIVHVDSK